MLQRRHAASGGGAGSASRTAKGAAEEHLSLARLKMTHCRDDGLSAAAQMCTQ